MNTQIRPPRIGPQPWDVVREKLDQSLPFANMRDTPYYRDAVWEQFSQAEYQRRYKALRDKMRAALEKVAAATRDCAVVVGYVGAAPGGVGLANAAAVCAGGRVAGVYRKRFLPNYGVFDEQRWFVPSEEPPALFGIAGAWVGVSICEDVWFDNGPVAQAGRGGADVVVNLNASPYNRGRRAERLAMLSGRVAEARCAIAYVNQVGGQDELVFDGDSLLMGADGTLLGAGAQFAEDLVVVDLPIGSHPARVVTELLPRIVVSEPRRLTIMVCRGPTCGERRNSATGK